MDEKEAIEMFRGFVSGKEIDLIFTDDRFEEIYDLSKSLRLSNEEQVTEFFDMELTTSQSGSALKIAPWLRVEDDF